MTSEQLFELILKTGRENNEILMIGSEGSRNNPSITPDIYQDFDITYFVENERFADFKSFNRTMFGEIMIEQILPESNRWCWLMHFMDDNRLDLKIQPISSVSNYLLADTLNTILLDKTGKYLTLPATSERSHFIKRPNQQEFDDTINEFFWLATYVVKGILRHEFLYATYFFEQHVRLEFYKLLAWHVGIETDFSISLGKANKKLLDYFSELTQTYDLSSLSKIAFALKFSVNLVINILPNLSQNLQLTYEFSAVEKTTDYIFRKLKSL
ncbi:aminoglycoside nucleotidyltransferase ANT(6)-Ia [Lactococcus hodotermopsidis]|uniref:Aminoglycoside nucleotidyltransferase ANT(6)-Ia n=1 Tax=Pseudolactococcus hodotermopsidis TaxID=2709157 RepID=A0A6A0B8P4_9LACT|nr:aminoglycoside 6-adenylyltransferase [Lactococcus hodotermopsidis]GFH41780.1 aminoglycoside nucleotidyltransferase ANT(6)-Ia [Lactococcus hodotermopsidis]